MRILLIDPPFYRIIGFYNRYYPLGLVSLGTVLNGSGLDVAVYDADYNEKPVNIDYSRLPETYESYLSSFTEKNRIWDEARRTIRDFQPDIVGISIWTTFAASSYFIARIVKDINEHCIVVMGGPHANVKAEEILRISGDVDYVIRGEGEETMVMLVNYISGEKIKLQDIHGLSYRNNGKIFHNQIEIHTRNLDSYPIPNRSLLIHETKYTPEDMGLVMTSRGCPYSCSFCATQKKVVSFRSPANIIDEIRIVRDKYRTVQFTFKDDTFTMNSQRVIEFCRQLIEEKIKINWTCNTRVNLIGEEIFRLMKQSGCNGVSIGIESGSERILKSMNKGITLTQIREAVRIIKKVGIHLTGYYMIGVPGETEEDILKTIDLIKELNTDFVNIGVYEPFPGTAMFDKGIKSGILTHGMELSDFYSTNPNNYYRKIPLKYLDTMDNERFLKIEKVVKHQVNVYNKNLLRLLKIVKARVRSYLLDPISIFIDVKRFISYRKRV